MITHIRMKNFKSWADSGKVELAVLTGFFGTNSSGKSSLLQMLLLLKQTAERKDAEEVIFFGDNNSHVSYVNLGDFGEVIHGHNTEESLELGFGCKLQELSDIRVPLKSNRSNNTRYVSDGIDSFNFKTIIKENEGKLYIDDFSYRSSNFTLEKDPYNMHVYLNNSVIGNITEIKNCYGVPASEESGLGKILQQFSSLFGKLFDHVYYLGPTRVNSQRLYQWEGRHPGHAGQWGNQTIDALLSARVRNLKTSHEKEGIPIEQSISDWLQKMDLAHSFSLDWTKGATYEVRIQKTPSSPPVTLVDMGYGLSQFLPVLVLCYYAPEGSTLILEQPGIHLHPMVQSQLADLLIEVVNERKLQILVESHSEHLLTRLQRRIAEKQIPEENVALYFCRNNDGASTIEKLEVDEESGDIKNWPENFFGDVMGDMFAMTDKQTETIAETEPEG
ncbi:MAG: DUF3696 domain-containing protein [Candidatus Poribacteria bacterium]|nr:DUF3696 domain-containing protein [Candidatus Poribacteria bacterium]